MPISENIATAIEQLRPELPTWLGNDSCQFLAQLEDALAQGNEDQVLALFDEEKYPALYNRLLNLLGQQGGNRGTTKGGVILPGDVTLHGDVILNDDIFLTQISAAVKRGTLFYCPESKHLVELPQEALGHPEEEYRCPTHNQLLRKIGSDNIEKHRREGIGYMFYCNAGSHLLLLARGDFCENEEGDILCPKHRKKIQRITFEPE